MMDILDRNRSELDVTALGFDSAIRNARTLLQGSATLELLSSQIIDQRLAVRLKVNNLSGHKLPTSYPSRRVFIHFTVKDEQGTTLFESGRLNNNGSIVGNDMDSDFNRYEPHYNEISAEDQVQIYEPVMQNSDGAVTHTLLRAAAYIKDNRLTPLGFDKNQVSTDVAVKGAAFNDSDFNLGSDTLTYYVDLKNSTQVTLEVELNYQALAFGHLQEMFSDSATLPEVATFQGYFEDPATLRAETLVSLTTTLETAALTSTATATPAVDTSTAAVATESNSSSNNQTVAGSLSNLSLWLLLGLLAWLKKGHVFVNNITFFRAVEKK